MSQTPQRLWHTQIETGMETGQTPLLDLGLSWGILPGLNPLLALLTLAEERLDMTQPRVVIGGEGSGWLVALLATPPTAPPQQAPALTITYGGPDPATQLASVGIGQNPEARTRAPQRPLPGGFAAWFIGGEPVGANSWAPAILQTVTATEPRLLADRWLQWAGLLLALALVILALIV